MGHGHSHSTQGAQLSTIPPFSTYALMRYHVPRKCEWMDRQMLMIAISDGFDEQQQRVKKTLVDWNILFVDICEQDVLTSLVYDTSL